MTHEEFVKEYGTRWKTMFDICVWNVPPMREWLRVHWNAVYESIAQDGIEGTPELWLKLAHVSAMEKIDEIIGAEKAVEA